MEISVAQSELRSAYLRGGTGAVVSGIVWLLAAMSAVGVAAIFTGLPAPHIVPYLIAAVEIVFGFCLALISLANDTQISSAGEKNSTGG